MLRINQEQKAVVFNVRLSEKAKNTRIANLSTYDGKSKDEEPKYSSWFANFVGKAFDASEKLKDKDKIVITSGKVENNYVKEKEKSYTIVTIFEFELVEDEAQKEE